MSVRKSLIFVMTLFDEHETIHVRGESRGGRVSIMIPNTLLISYAQNDKCSNQRCVYYTMHKILKNCKKLRTDICIYTNLLLIDIF